MKVKNLIKELKKYNPESEVFVDKFLELGKISHVKKIKIFEDTKTLSYMDCKTFNPLKMKWASCTRYNQAAMNTKNPQAILISSHMDFRQSKKIPSK